MRSLFIALALTLPAVASSATQEPKDVVQDIFLQAGAPEIATDAEKQRAVSSLVDFDALARSALGKEYRKVSSEEFAWFRDTLREIIGRTVYPKAPDFLSGVKITYNSVDAKGGRASVKSTVQNKADLTDVDYQLASQKDGVWKVVDVSIAGQSWVESINDQVSSVIRKKKWKGLRDSMSRRLRELKSGKG